MFPKLSLLALVAPLAVSALKLDIPENPTSSGTITIKWTNEQGDPDTWSFELTNDSFNRQFAIANNVNPSASSLTLTLPVVPVGSGYTLQAVNIGNITDVFAETGEFAIGAATTLSSSAGPSTTASGSATRSASNSAGTTSATTPAVTTTNAGFSTNIVSATTPLTTAATTSGSASGSAGSAATSGTTFSGSASRLGGSTGGYAAILLSAIAGAAMLAL